MWIFVFKQQDIGMWNTYEVPADNKDEAILKIAEMLRLDGQKIEMSELLYAVHEAPDDYISG